MHLHDYFHHDEKGELVLAEIVKTNSLPEISKVSDVIDRFKKVFV